MSDTAVISVENLSKLYRLGEIGTGMLQHDLNRWWHKIRGKGDPYAKVGNTNDRTRKSDSDWVWALQDVNFSVKQGEVLGIIGRNGAGKSTLLKILSRVTAPSRGQIKVKGRIASLLEVGTGFHPELTGKENIYLNGAILGMRRQEITSRLREIVEFSGCGAYMDTPVKRYSSGMYVRLAFAVAAHLEPEILVVDEVLAVGDVEFQKRCLDRMSLVAEAGRTVLFVSHNLGAVQTLCKSILRIDKGCVAAHSSAVGQEIKAYLKSSEDDSAMANWPIKISSSARMMDMTLEPVSPACGESLTVKLDFEFSSETRLTDCALLIYDQEGKRVAICDARLHLTLPRTLGQEKLQVAFNIPELPLIPGTYRLGLFLQASNGNINDYNLVEFQVMETPGLSMPPYPAEHRGIVSFHFQTSMA